MLISSSRSLVALFSCLVIGSGGATVLRAGERHGANIDQLRTNHEISKAHPLHLKRNLQELDDPCSVQPTTSRSSNYDNAGNDDSIRDPILELDNIDKITRIKVYAGDYFFNFVVSKLEVTYRLTDGTETTLSRGNGGTLQGTMDFDDGVYLTDISMQVGAYVDYVKLCASNGECKGPWGGKRGSSPNQRLNKEKSTIKAIFGKHGAVVDRLGCYFETNKLFRAELYDVAYKPFSAPELTDKSFNDPRAIEILENFDTSSPQSSEIEFSTTVATSETSTVTESRELSVEVSLSVTAKTFFVDASFGVTVGSSFSTSFEESNTESFEESITRTYTLVAQPGTKVTAEIYYQEVEYSFKWDAPLRCYFQYAPSVAVDGFSFEGSTVGSQVIPQGLVRLSEEAVDISTALNDSEQEEGTAPPVIGDSNTTDEDTDSGRGLLSCGSLMLSLCGVLFIILI